MKIGYTGYEQDILDPDGFVITPFEIAKYERTASGRLVKDVIAVKNKFTLQYDAFSAADADLFLEYYIAGKAVNFIYSDAGREKSATVYITDIPRELYIYDWQYSQNITITLEEV